jgi:hypothetical protein
LVLAGLTFALGAIVSAEYPPPPCDPKCPRTVAVPE